MKKRIVLPLIIVTMVAITIMFWENPNIKYSSGRDTVLHLGDGTFQILEGDVPPFHPEYEISSKYYILGKMDNSLDVELNVYKYCKKDKLLYTIGEGGYTVLNYETGEYTQSEDLDDFSIGDKTILLEETKFKILME